MVSRLTKGTVTDPVCVSDYHHFFRLKNFNVSWIWILDLFVVVFKGALEEGLGTGADHKVLKSRIYIFAEAIE